MSDQTSGNQHRTTWTARRAIILSAIMVVSVVAVPAFGASIGAGAMVDDGGSLEATEYEFSENISVWENSVFPLRVHGDNASTTVPGSTLEVEDESQDAKAGLDKDIMYVYDTGDTISLSLEEKDEAVLTDFEDEPATLIVGKVKQNGGSSQIPTTLGNLQNLNNLETANGNITFTETLDAGTIPSSGVLDTGFTPDTPGAYVVLLATGETDTFDIDNDGNLSANSDTTIVGMDSTLVQSGQSTVSDIPEEVVDSEPASFTLDTDANGQVNHSIVLYHEDTMTGSTTTIRVDEVSTDIDTGNVTLDLTLGEVNGDIDVNETSVNGQTLEAIRQSGTFTSEQVVETLIDRANETNDDNFEQPTVEAGDGTLDLSMATRTNESGEITVSLPTFENWSTGEYRWVHVAGNENALYTDTGTLTVKESKDDTTDGGDEDDSTDDGDTDDGTDDGDDDDGDTAPGGGTGGGGSGGAPPAQNVVTIDQATNEVVISIQNPAREDTITVDLPEQAVAGNGYGLSKMDVALATDSDVQLNVTPTRPQGTPERANALGYLNVEHAVPESDVGTVTFGFSVDASVLDERDVDPGDVSLYRYHDGEWNELETAHLAEVNGSHEFTATSPGLSVFAIGTAGEPAAEPVFSVDELTVDTQSISVDESATITATIANTGNASGEYTAELLADGAVVDSTTVTVPAGESATVTFEPGFAEPGTYTVSVGDASATLEVTGAAEPGTGQPGTEGPDDSRFPGLVTGLTALLVFAAILVVYWIYRLDQ